MLAVPADRGIRPLLFYFVLANLLSWTAWAPLAAAGMGWTSSQFSPELHLLGGLGPLIAAAGVTYASEGRTGLARLAERSTRLRGRCGWVALSVAGPMLLFGVSALGLRIGAGMDVDWSEIGRSNEYPDLSRPEYWLANVFFYGFGEEVGWRGFALPRIQARTSAFNSALLVGCAWASWHLPLFAFAGGLSAMGVGAIAGWLFSIMTGSIVMTWLFNSSGGSVLGVALFHGVLDILMASPVRSPLPSVMGALIVLFGMALLRLYGRENLSRSPKIKDQTVA